ncbi:MAG: carbohydrate kinase family protein [Lacisediminihabitans sp.]
MASGLDSVARRGETLPLILIAGEALIDLIGHGNGSYRAVPGGSAVNVAVALGQLGRPVELLCRLSGDAMSLPLRAKLIENGVGLSYAVAAQELTTLAVATIDVQGSASYSFYVNGTADWQWSAGELPPDGVAPAVLHIGSIALSLPPGAQVLADYAARLHRAGQTTVTFDPNIRLGLGASAEFEAARVLRQLSTTHIVKVSDDDLLTLFPGEQPEQLLRDWSSRMGVHAVLTRGDGGVFSVRPGGAEFELDSRPASPLVDTVGAGDTFWGAMLDQLAQLDALGPMPAERLAACPDAQWRESLRFATVAASLVCERVGAQPPSRAEVLAALVGFSEH